MDSLFAQQIAVSFRAGALDGGIQVSTSVKVFVGEIEGLRSCQAISISLSRRVLGRALDDEPMGGYHGGRAEVNRAVSERNHDGFGAHVGFGAHAGFGTVEVIEGNQERNKIGAELGAGGDDDQLAPQPVECTMATFFDCPGAGTRKSAPRLAGT
jgi:hypothetical protein